MDEGIRNRNTTKKSLYLVLKVELSKNLWHTRLIFFHGSSYQKGPKNDTNS